MSIGLINNVLNQKGTPAFYSDVFANRPTYGFAGRVFISTDTGAIYEDTGTAWTLIADAGAGTTGTLEQVTTNGNSTTKGLVVTSGNIAIGTATAGAPLDIHATGTNAQFNGTGTNNAYLQFQNAGANKWRIGNTYAAGSNNLDIYNNSLASNALSFNLATNAATFNNSVTATSLITSGGTSAQFVKGNGTLDSGTYLPITGGISTDQVLKVYSSGGNFYLGSSTISDNGTSVTINGRITSNSDTISVNGTASNIQMQINNQTATTGKQWYLNSKSTGILGIGNNTTSDVLTFASTGTATFLQGIQSTGTADQQLFVYGSSPSLRLYNTLSSPTITGFVGMATGVNNFILGSASGDMCIGTSTAGKIYIGSGTTTVSPAMTVLSNNTILINGTPPSTGQLNIVGSNAGIALAMSDNINSSLYFRMSNAGGIIGTDPSANINFATGGNTSADVKMRLNNAGNLLLGTTTDAGSKLQVNGEGNFGTPTNGTQQVLIGSGGSTNPYVSINGGSSSNTFGNSARLAIVDNINSRNWGLQTNASYNLCVWHYNGAWANLGNFNNATGIYTPTSDYNKKKDFEASEIGLNAILGLKPTLFRMKTEDENVSKTLGFIAQEVKEFIPQAYVQNEDFIGLSDRPIIAALVKSIQELNEKLVRNNIN